MIRFASFRSFCLAVFLLLLGLAEVYPQEKPQAQPSNPSDEAAIRALIQKTVEGWNKGSGEEFAAPFAEDADFMVVNGIYLKGRKEIAAQLQRSFDTFMKGTRVWLEVKSVRFLSSDIALVHAWGKILRPGESVERPEPGAISTRVMSKRGGSWRVAAFQNTAIQPSGGPPR